MKIIAFNWKLIKRSFFTQFNVYCVDQSITHHQQEMIFGQVCTHDRGRDNHFKRLSIYAVVDPSEYSIAINTGPSNFKADWL